MTFDEYKKNLIALTKASGKPDVVAKRYTELAGMQVLSPLQKKELVAIEKAIRAKWRLEGATEKARSLIGKANSEDRKAVDHAKILIGLAAIQLAENNPDLKVRLSALACAMTSAKADVINALLEKKRVDRGGPVCLDRIC